MLSTIILKLLEKHPDNRYQTVDGLIADLRRCQATLTCEGEIVAFTPGQQDRTPAIHLADSCSRRIRRRTTSLPRLSGWGRTWCRSW
jgi:serine/threonine protein kinase